MAGDWDFTRWMDVRVGNLLYIKQDEEIPCDLLIFSTSHPEGVCFVNTNKIDGESNLKQKFAPQDTQIEYGIQESAIQNLLRLENSLIKCENPISKLYSFSGSLELQGYARSIPLNLKNLLLRGSLVKNTE